MEESAAEKRARIQADFKARRYALGFKQINLWVHEDDRELFKDLELRRYNKKIKEINRGN